MNSPADSDYIPAIDGVRAIAILLVISSHLGAEHFIPGGFGVTLFFFVSGYLITKLMISEYEANGKVDITSFYIRRFLRLAPALMTMIAAVSLIFLTIDPIPLPQILAAAFYYGNYYKIIVGGSTSPLDPMWSLAVEEHYYLLFPLVLAASWRFKRRFLQGLIIVALAVLLWRCALVFHWHAPTNRTYLSTDTRIDSILYGAVLASALNVSPRIATAWSRRLWVIGLIAVAASLLVRDEHFRETFRYSIQGAALIPLFYCAIFDSRFSFVSRILDSKPLIWIGKLSYSLYLWHFAVLMFSERVLPSSGRAYIVLFNIAADLMLACASYYFIERYFLSLRSRFRPSERVIRSKIRPEAAI